MSARSAAITGALLALPFALLYTLLVTGIEPPLGPLEPLVTVDSDQPNVVGTAIVVTAWALSLVGFVISMWPAVRKARAGGGILTHPVNLALGFVILSFIGAFVGSVVADQYPCWTGVPNCD